MLRVTLDGIRRRIAKAEALSHATETLFDGMIWQEGAIDRRQLERLAHLIGATHRSVARALKAIDAPAGPSDRGASGGG